MLSTSPSKQEIKGDDPDFTWGKKRGVGGPKKDVQFYESFVYDGVEYFLYDCVYLYKDGDPEPYIGKLIKIWEQNHKKKIKVQWFFRSIEILNWLEDDEVIGNEIFLACGEGVGLEGINPLEVLVGKCNVVCTSKDERNPQPSEEDIKAADYIFFRTFDVKSCTITDCIKDKVGGLEARCVFNKEDAVKSVVKLQAMKKDETAKELTGVVIESSLTTSPRPKLVESLPNDKTSHAPIIAIENKTSKPNFSIVKDKENQGRITNSSSTLEEEKSDNLVQRSTFTTENELDKVSEKSKVRSGQELGRLDNVSSKKLKISDNSANQVTGMEVTVSDQYVPDKSKSNNKNEKLKFDVKEEHDNALDVPAIISEKSKEKPLNDSIVDEKKSSITKNVEKNAKHLENVAHKVSSFSPKDIRTDGQIMEISRRPDADRSKWFKGRPWEERLQTAHEQGTLVLLENFDPSYTSTEIEDIIWHSFKEHCTARVMPRAMNSSPHCGRAFVVFKSREAAEMAVKRLDRECLMLPNGRPLVASKGIPNFPEKSAKFAGHLVIDKVKLQMQRDEMKQAVSTSHCSQPNTIEFEMAMDWRLLQAKADIWWRDLYKQQSEDMRKLRNSLKTK